MSEVSRMTAHERAEELLRKLRMFHYVILPDHEEVEILEITTAAITAAVDAERERCAKLIEPTPTDSPSAGITYWGRMFADRIRSSTAGAPQQHP